MSKEIRFAKSEKESCGECRHFFWIAFPRIRLGKYHANGWCYDRETKKPFYTANNMICDEFTSFWEKKSDRYSGPGDKYGTCIGYSSDPCPNCGRFRLEKYDSGKEVCEKCNWCPQENDYAEWSEEE